MSDLLNLILICVFILFIFYVLIQWLLLPTSIVKSLEGIEQAIKELKRK